MLSAFLAAAIMSHIQQTKEEIKIKKYKRTNVCRIQNESAVLVNDYVLLQLLLLLFLS